MHQIHVYAFEILTHKNKPNEVSNELLLHFETDTQTPIKKLEKKKQEWKNDYGVLAYKLTDEQGTVTRYQYKRMLNENEDGYYWGQNKKRGWQVVDSFNLDYETVHFALTGRSY